MNPLVLNENIQEIIKARFSVTDGQIEIVLANLCRGGEKGFGVLNASSRLDVVFRNTLGHVASNGLFAKHIQTISESSVAEHAALCGAAERLCLWFRAHEVSNGVDLANYFETAFNYFVEYWKSKSNDEINKQLSGYPAKRPSSLTRPKSRGRSAVGRSKIAPANSGPKATNTSLSSSASKSIISKRQFTASKPVSTNNKTMDGSGGDRSTQVSPSKRSPSRPTIETSRSNESSSHVSKSPTKLRSTSSTSTMQVPPQQSCIDVKLKVTAPVPQGKGKNVELEPSTHPKRPKDSSVRWLQIAVGPSYHQSLGLMRQYEVALEVDDWTSESNDSKRDAGYVNIAGLGLPTSMTSLSSMSQGLNTSSSSNLITNVFDTGDVNTDESSWWQSRYETADSDFELEVSDPDQNSDTEMGDDETPAIPLSPLKKFTDNEGESQATEIHIKDERKMNGRVLRKGSLTAPSRLSKLTEENSKQSSNDEEEEEEDEEDDEEDESDESDDDDDDDDDDDESDDDEESDADDQLGTVNGKTERK